MKEAYISFYLRENQIYVFVEALKQIGSPRRICFMLSKSGESLLLVPYKKRDFKSHSVPAKVYHGNGNFRINSYKLCRMLADINHWDMHHSYRIPGKVYPEKRLAVFELESARVIGREQAE